MRGGSRLFRALHVLNTSNVTSPMPPNSAASATESYSSQCQYVSTISFPCYHHFFLGSDRGGGSGPVRKLMSPGCLLYCLGLPGDRRLGAESGRPLRYEYNSRGDQLFRASQSWSGQIALATAAWKQSTVIGDHRSDLRMVGQ